MSRQWLDLGRIKRSPCNSNLGRLTDAPLLRTIIHWFPLETTWFLICQPIMVRNKRHQSVILDLNVWEHLLPVWSWNNVTKSCMKIILCHQYEKGEIGTFLHPLALSQNSRQLFHLSYSSRVKSTKSLDREGKEHNALETASFCCVLDFPLEGLDKGSTCLC